LETGGSCFQSVSLKEDEMRNFIVALVVLCFLAISPVDAGRRNFACSTCSGGSCATGVSYSAGFTAIQQQVTIPAFPSGFSSPAINVQPAAFVAAPVLPVSYAPAIQPVNYYGFAGGCAGGRCGR